MGVGGQAQLLLIVLCTEGLALSASAALRGLELTPDPFPLVFN